MRYRQEGENMLKLMIDNWSEKVECHGKKLLFRKNVGKSRVVGV